MADQRVRDDDIECRIGKHEAVRVAGLESDPSIDLLVSRETVRRIDEMAALIDSQRLAGKVVPARDRPQHSPRAAAHFQDLGGWGQGKSSHIVVEQACKDTITCPAFKSGDETFECGLIKFIDETVGVTRSHASPHL